MNYHQKSFNKVLNTASRYGSGYGDCTIIETPRCIIFEFYNAGYSVCEEDDSELRRTEHPEIDDHPHTVYIFQKGLLTPESYNGIATKKLKKYVYKLERE